MTRPPPGVGLLTAANEYSAALAERLTVDADEAILDHDLHGTQRHVVLAVEAPHIETMVHAAIAVAGVAPDASFRAFSAAAAAYDRLYARDPNTLYARAYAATLEHWAAQTRRHRSYLTSATRSHAPLAIDLAESQAALIRLERIDGISAAPLISSAGSKHTLTLDYIDIALNDMGVGLPLPKVDERTDYRITRYDDAVVAANVGRFSDERASITLRAFDRHLRGVVDSAAYDPAIHVKTLDRLAAVETRLTNAPAAGSSTAVHHARSVSSTAASNWLRLTHPLLRAAHHDASVSIGR